MLFDLKIMVIFYSTQLAAKSGMMMETRSYNLVACKATLDDRATATQIFPFLCNNSHLEEHIDVSSILWIPMIATLNSLVFGKRHEVC